MGRAVCCGYRGGKYLEKMTLIGFFQGMASILVYRSPLLLIFHLLPLLKLNQLVS